jgi:tetratricopeptide (TPR) repeat protein
VAIALLLILVAAGVAVVRFGARPQALTDRDSILLAEFANNTGDPVFEDTLAQALAVQLSQSPFLNLVSQDRVRETLTLMGRPPDTRLTHAVGREACQRMGVKAMLHGSIASVGRLYVVALDATNCETGESIGREQIEAQSKEEVLQALGRGAASIRARLGESLKTIERFNVPIQRATTPSIEALRAYTLGMAQRAKGAEVESIPFFLRAIELDPNFAAAYNTLSTVYGSLGEWARSEEYARLAFARRDGVSERERLFIAYQYHDRVTGDQLQTAETLEVWKQSYPRDFTPPNALSIIYFRLGRYDLAVREATEAARRNPAHPFPLSNLAYAHRGLNQFAESKQAAQKAVDLKIETTPTRRLLYQMAVMENDVEAAEEHMAWARGRSREFDLIGAQAQIAAFEGRMADARALYGRTTEMAIARGFGEAAAAYVAHEAWTEVLYGNRTEALAAARSTRSRSRSDSLDSRVVPRYRTSAALALAGAIGEAAAIVAESVKRAPDSTLTQAVLVPVTNAGIALVRRDPDAALEALRAASTYELGTAAGYAPIYLRGQAFLMKGAGRDAAAEFQRILDHRGVDPFSPLYSLSYLGLGRALAAAGEISQARHAYDRFFEIWARADADLPILKEARAEYARLGT